MSSGHRIVPPLTSAGFSLDGQEAHVRAPVLMQEPLQPAPTAATSPSDEDAENAVRTLLRWMGEDTGRDGLVDTPARVVRGWKEFFKGYGEDPRDHLKKTFPNTDGYNEMVCLENIRLESYCEHHLVPITGTACIAYIPGQRIAGLSKLARVAEGYAKRLQIQEKLTRQIAGALQEMLQPQGVAVAIRSEHQCLSTRGIHKVGSDMFTLATFGAFETDAQRRAEFLAIVNRRG